MKCLVGAPASAVETACIPRVISIASFWAVAALLSSI
jgi:hypothetical protein